VFATARRVHSMQALGGLPGVELIHLDLCSSDSINAAVAQIVSKAGRIDILVSNEGYKV